jgi:outer membrane protein TolC
MLLAVVASAPASADPLLNLSQAESMALDTDPAVQAIRARAGATRERAIAAAQLPDPKLRFGAAALPVDSFDLDQEPMTQLQVGYQQRFMPGNSLSLRGDQLDRQAAALDHWANDRRWQTLRDVRADFIEVLYHQRAAGILREARGIFAELLAVTSDHYASGRATQQDVYRSELELSRLDERLARIVQGEDVARGRLSEWVGSAAGRPLATEWPQLGPVRWPENWPNAIAEHPRLRAIAEQLSAENLAVDVAREQYKPGWTLDVAYGDRSGQNLDGSARADFLTAMVSIDLPLFRGSRQDRELAASLMQVDAVQATRDDEWRKLQRGAEREHAVLTRLEERLGLYDDRLLPEARANSDAAMDAYQSGVADFTTLMRARLTEIELRIEHARAQADRLMAVARLNYYLGESS